MTYLIKQIAAKPRIELMPFTEVAGLDGDDHGLAAGSCRVVRPVNEMRDLHMWRRRDARGFVLTAADTLATDRSGVSPQEMRVADG